MFFFCSWINSANIMSNIFRTKLDLFVTYIILLYHKIRLFKLIYLVHKLVGEEYSKNAHPENSEYFHINNLQLDDWKMKEKCKWDYVSVDKITPAHCFFQVFSHLISIAVQVIYQWWNVEKNMIIHTFFYSTCISTIKTRWIFFIPRDIMPLIFF